MNGVKSQTAGTHGIGGTHPNDALRGFNLRSNRCHGCFDGRLEKFRNFVSVIVALGTMEKKDKLIKMDTDPVSFNCPPLMPTDMSLSRGDPNGMNCRSFLSRKSRLVVSSKRFVM